MLPDDVERLKGLVIAAQSETASVRAALLIEQLTNEKLRFQIAVLKRARYGRSSEQLDAELAQIELTLEDLEASVAALPTPVPPAVTPSPKPARRPLPEHLPREEIVHPSPCACPACGGALRAAGEDVAEMLEWVPGRYKVLRHVRPKFACARCETLIQAPAPARPIARGVAGPGLLAHVLVGKYADHLPLYRQSQIFARDGAVEALRQARDQKMVRFLGITGHYDPDVLARAIARFPFDTVLMAVNPADRHRLSFIERLLPLATEKGMGVIGMKIPARGRIFKDGAITSIRPPLRYVLSLPISTAIIGCDNVEQLEENIAVARAFSPMRLVG